MRNLGKIRRGAALFCALLLLAGCRGAGKIGAGNDAREDGGPLSAAKSEGVLENVWEGTEYEIPKDMTPISRTEPHFNPATGVLTFLARTSFTDEEGNRRNEYAVVTHTGKSYSLDLLDLTEDQAASESVNIDYGVFTPETFWYVIGRYNGGDVKRFLGKRDLETGEEERWELGPFFHGGDGILEDMTADAEGDIWIRSASKVVALHPDGTEFLSIPFEEQNGQVLPFPDGSVRITLETPAGRVLARIDKNTGEKSEELPLHDRHYDLAYKEGYDYVFAASGGVFGAKIDAKKEIVSECLMDFVNSGVNPDSVTLWGPAGEDWILFYETDGEYFTPEYYARPVLYRPAGETFIADVTVLEVAYTSALWDRVVPDAIAQFNKTHKDARIVTLDYSVYSKEYGDTTAADRLTMDMVTGLCAPDIILGRPGEDAQIEQLLRKHLYVDLGPYLDKDPEVNRETLLGGVLRAFSDEHGEVWGLPNHISFDSLVANRRVLDKYGMKGKDSWTLGEFLDFADALPPDIVLIGGLTQEKAMSLRYGILGNFGLDAFFDEAAGKCAFDDPLFVRWLKFVSSLPKDESELKKRSPFDAEKDSSKYDWLMTDRVALARMYGYDATDCVRFESTFGTKDWVLVGYPSAEGSGTEISSTIACCVTTFCPDPDAAWDFVRTVVLSKKQTTSFSPNLSALRDGTESAMKTSLNRDYVQYFNGEIESNSPKKDPPLTKEDLRKPGYIIDFTKEDADRILAELDRAGKPITKMIPAAVQEIVAEEISTYLGGLGSAEDCAGKIQSRVSIWLAEHS